LNIIHDKTQRRAQTSSGTVAEGPKWALNIFFVFVFILSFLGILRKYVDIESNTSNENREMMIILLNIIYFTKQNRDHEGNCGKFIFRFLYVNLMFVLYV